MSCDREEIGIEPLNHIDRRSISKNENQYSTQLSRVRGEKGIINANYAKENVINKFGSTVMDYIAVMVYGMVAKILNPNYA